MNREYLLSMIKELVSVKSVTESADESKPCEMLRERFAKLEYFNTHPENLILIDTPLEGSPYTLKALVARVDAEKKTDKTLLLIGHCDVVSAECYGELEKYAFDCDKLSKILNADENTLYGRGSMDMKCGVAIEAAVIEEFAADRKMFDVNIVMALVGDEENTSAGLRGILPCLAEMKKNGTDFLCAINTEPGEAGEAGKPGPKVFTGTMGKVMPGFYARGKTAHVGNYYDGFSAGLAIAHLVSDAEANPMLSDKLGQTAYPSWTCLDMKIMRELYSVSVPDRAYAYFNCFSVANTPETVIRQMKNLARLAIIESEEQLVDSRTAIGDAGYKGSKFKTFEPLVYTLGELKNLARKKNKNFDCELEEFTKKITARDMRVRALKTVDFTADKADIDNPYIVCFFLPPWLPAGYAEPQDPRWKTALSVVNKTKKRCLDIYGEPMKEAELFTGLCDLSYVGGKISDNDIESLSQNMAGWGAVYHVPLEELKELQLPILNLGPSGEAAHKKEERLYLKYSLEILPQLLIEAIRDFSALC